MARHDLPHGDCDTLWVVRGVTHHDLCFGCGVVNVFGLHLELTPAEGGGLSGRFFAKQDHMGRRGVIHPGVVVTALEEAMALCLLEEAPDAVPERLDVDLGDAAPLGTWIEVTAEVTDRHDGTVTAKAAAVGEPGMLAAVVGVYAVPLRVGERPVAES